MKPSKDPAKTAKLMKKMRRKMEKRTITDLEKMLQLRRRHTLNGK